MTVAGAGFQPTNDQHVEGAAPTAAPDAAAPGGAGAAPAAGGAPSSAAATMRPSSLGFNAAALEARLADAGAPVIQVDPADLSPTVSILDLQVPADWKQPREITASRESLAAALDKDPGGLAGEMQRLADTDPAGYEEALSWLQDTGNNAAKILPVLDWVGGPGGGRLQADVLLALRGRTGDAENAAAAARGEPQITDDMLTKATAHFLQMNPTGFLGYLEGSPTLQSQVPDILKPVLTDWSNGKEVIGGALGALAADAARAADAAGKAAPGSPEKDRARDQAYMLGQAFAHIEDTIHGVASDRKAQAEIENTIMGFALDAVGKAVDVVAPEAKAGAGIIIGQLKKVLEGRLADIDADAKSKRHDMVDILFGTFEAVNDPLRSRSNHDKAYQDAYVLYKQEVAKGRNDTHTFED
jgi:hypothetical protein